MRVTVLDRRNWGCRGPYPDAVTVDISDLCPKCGGPRGKTVQRNHAEDGQYLVIDTWTNSCGHVDLYPTVLKESESGSVIPAPQPRPGNWNPLIKF